MRSVLNEVTKAYWLTRFASKQSDNSVSIRSVLIKVTKACIVDKMCINNKFIDRMFMAQSYVLSRW